jgi:uncharacterized protein YjbI with pentapeptide repeats
LRWYSANSPTINPVATFLGAVGAFITAVVVAWTGVRNARTASERHVAQTEADRQRRLTESYSKAVEQLASEKVAERLGGIYTLEQISTESESRYWTVMETLTAFVRERARWKEPDPAMIGSMARYYEIPKELDERRGPEPPTDIAAVLTVIRRRSKENRQRERQEGWRFDLRGTDLRGADLTGSRADEEGNRKIVSGTDLRAADLRWANLDGAYLYEAHLAGANLRETHLAGAYLVRANLEFADLRWAHLADANLEGAHLVGADLREAHLDGVYFGNAHLELADMRGATGLKAEMFAKVLANVHTKLPDGVEPPAHWPRKAPR